MGIGRSIRSWLLLLSLMMGVGGHAYDVAICTLFKNEAPWLVEWLEYHKMMGVEHFFLYDNGSSDHVQEVLEPYVRRGEVDLIFWTDPTQWIWPGPTFESWRGHQITAFHDAVRRAIGKANWLMVMDVDEYLYPHGGVKSFQSLLHPADPRVGSMSFSWQCFGTSFVERIPSNQLLIETLVWRGADDLDANNCVKTMYRPEAVLMVHIHEGSLRENYHHRAIDRSVVRLNHYTTRDREACRRKEALRNDGTVLDWRSVERLYDEVFDDGMSQYVPALKERVHQSCR